MDGRLTESTDGGAFLYRFSRFLLGAPVAVVCDVGVEAVVSDSWNACSR